MIDPFEKKYRSFTLEHPYGSARESVRVHPPVAVPVTHDEKTNLFVCIPNKYGGTWHRRCIKRGDRYPEAFAAWDEAEQEWAMHEPGEDSVTARPPTLRQVRSRMMTGLEEIEAVSPRPGRRRRTLTEWFLGKSPANRDPDFLRKSREETT